MIKLTLVGLTGLLAAACVPTTTPSWLVQPADAHLGNKAPRYSNVTAGVKKFDVVDPKDWRELNRAVGPQGRSGTGSEMPGMDMGNKRDTGGR